MVHETQPVLEQRAEGVERIDEDGTIVFTETSYSVMKEIVGFDLARSFSKDIVSCHLD